MEDIYMSGEGLCRTEDKSKQMPNCPAKFRTYGQLTILAQWRCKSIRVSTHFLKLFYSFWFSRRWRYIYDN